MFLNAAAKKGTTILTSLCVAEKPEVGCTVRKEPIGNASPVTIDTELTKLERCLGECEQIAPLIASLASLDVLNWKVSEGDMR